MIILGRFSQQKFRVRSRPFWDYLNFAVCLGEGNYDSKPNVPHSLEVHWFQSLAAWPNTVGDVRKDIWS